MSDRLRELLVELDRLENGAAANIELDWLQTTDAESVSAVCRAVLADHHVVERSKSPLWQGVLMQLVRRQRTAPIALSDRDRARIAACYGQLDEASAVACRLLCLMTSEGSSASLARFADLIVDRPPQDVRAALEPFGDLFRSDPRNIESLFPRLLDGLENLSIAGLILDFCNYVARKRLILPHAAYSERRQLISLLSRLADRLEKIQEERPNSAEELKIQGRQVEESVAVAISLCDTLSLIGDPDAIGALRKTMELEHRRLRVEAAAALARLGEEAGRQILIEMAAEPSERLRVLAYADELEMSEAIDAQYTAPIARAEAELATWLAEPQQFGLPPSRIERIDHRTQFWPGFDDPVACYLFRFEYHFPQGTYANLGIAGPVVFSMSPDLTCLSVEDSLALFAGWHLEHPDVYAVDASGLTGRDQIGLHRLERVLRDAGLEDIRSQLLGWFLGQPVVVAFARCDDRTGIATADADAHHFVPQGDSERPLGPMEAFYLHVGRNLLESFNEQ